MLRRAVCRPNERAYYRGYPHQIKRTARQAAIPLEEGNLGLVP